MRYIAKHPALGWHFAPYFEYLESVRQQFPDPLYRFAANEENYNLTSHASLHDAWLESFTIRELGTGERKERRSIWIESSYLGPFQDLRIHLSYRGVTGYSLQTQPDLTPRSAETGMAIFWFTRSGSRAAPCSNTNCCSRAAAPT